MLVADVNLYWKKWVMAVLQSWTFIEWHAIQKIDWNQNHLNKLQNIESKSGPLPGRKVFVCSEHIELQI